MGRPLPTPEFPPPPTENKAGNYGKIHLSKSIVLAIFLSLWSEISQQSVTFYSTYSRLWKFTKYWNFPIIFCKILAENTKNLHNLLDFLNFSENYSFSTLVFGENSETSGVRGVPLDPPRAEAVYLVNLVPRDSRNLLHYGTLYYGIFQSLSNVYMKKVLFCQCFKFLNYRYKLWRIVLEF